MKHLVILLFIGLFCVAPGQSQQKSQNTKKKDTTTTTSSSTTMTAQIIDPGGGGGTLTTYYADNDMDGYGDPNVIHLASSQEIGYVLNNTDCNDSCFSCHPGATEVADGKDNDCDGQIDEGLGGTTPVTPSDESFETDFGVWIQDSSDDFDWSRQSGGTGSSGTGPSSPYDGSYYLYTESSSPNFGSKVANITSATYAMTSGLSLDFNYHMYGASMGSLTLLISTNGGISWSQLWTKSGDQGNQWLSASVSLSSYGGQDVKLRFRGITGSSYTSDMAIDNLVFSSSSGGGGVGCGSVSLSNENYVYSKTYLTETDTSLSNPAPEEVIEEVTYFDGLGRPMQQVGIHQAGGTGYEDIITYIEYDDYGRQVKEYLPYPSQTCAPGTYHSSALSETNTFYDGSAYDADFPGMTTSTINPYSEKDLEASPLNRLQKQAAPGAAWKMGGGHEIEFDYATNVSSEVRLYEVTTSLFNGIFEPTLVLSGYYNPGELYKTVTYDENNNSKATAHSTEEFKDKQGKVVLKRTYKGTTKYDTYYVYDDYGNLTYVLPPKSEPQSAKPDITEMSELCYQYKYDGRNRLAEKKLPGKGWEDIVYNKLDQPVLTRDQVLKAAGKWLLTKYDAFGRVAYTGYISSGNTRSQYQSTLYGGTTQYESRRSALSFGGTSIFYTKNAQPTAATEIYTINYYDDYNVNIGFSIPSSNTYGESIVTGIATKGLATVSKVKVLGTSSWITNAMGYDDKGRVIWIKTVNPYLGTTDIVEHDLDFTGNVKETRTTHQKSGEADIVIRDYFIYDHMKRLTKHSQSINGGAQELIAENTYDELGQLKRKDVGNAYGNALQTVDYAYNVRGWLKEINDVDNIGQDLFTFEISYNNPELSGSMALYNGNISETIWRTANDKIASVPVSRRAYNYEYDDLNRLVTATNFMNMSNSYKYRMEATYDKNGNLTRLKRGGKSNYYLIDDLGYSYDSGNKLFGLADNGTSYVIGEGFVDGTNTGNDYAYDANGNLTSDLNKGILAGGIKYNHLNLPTQVKFNNSSSQVIKYTYDATGVKLRKEIPGKITDYAGGFVYEQLGTGTKELQFFSTPEGYVSYENGQFKYVYNYVDHLGNVRLSYTDGDGDGSIDPATEIIQEKNYYPFGLTHQGYNYGGSPYGNAAAKRFGFGGKELQDETFSGNTLDWYDITARNYDPALGRWMNIDPLAEAMRRHSPYNYAFDNPIYFIDPDGQMPIGTNKDWINGGSNGLASTVVNENGEIIDYKDDGDTNIYLNERKSENIVGTEDENKSYIVGDYINQNDLNPQYHFSGLGPFRKIQHRINVTTFEVSPLLGGMGKGFNIKYLGNFYVRLKILLSGGKYNVTIQSLASLKEGTNLIKLLKTFEADAKTAGASKLVIEGIDIVNIKILEKVKLVERFGYNIEKIGKTTIQISKKL